jgi:hypothetical protein
VEMLWANNRIGSSPWSASHMIAGITMGPDVARGTGFDVAIVAVALVTHYVLGMVFGMILAAIIAPFHLDSSLGMVLLVGAVFGFLLYLLDFYGMARFFPWFTEMRGSPTLIAHLIFGMVAGGMYWQLERPAYT